MGMYCVCVCVLCILRSVSVPYRVKVTKGFMCSKVEWRFKAINVFKLNYWPLYYIILCCFTACGTKCIRCTIQYNTDDFGGGGAVRWWPYTCTHKLVCKWFYTLFLYEHFKLGITLFNTFIFFSCPLCPFCAAFTWGCQENFFESSYTQWILSFWPSTSSASSSPFSYKIHFELYKMA